MLLFYKSSGIKISDLFEQTDETIMISPFEKQLVGGRENKWESEI